MLPYYRTRPLTASETSVGDSIARDAQPLSRRGYQPALLPKNQDQGASFADPAKRIRQTVSTASLPAQVELLRSRLPAEDAPKRPPYPESPNTQHTLDVVVAALLAVTDGKLPEMQAAAEADGGSRVLTDAIQRAQATSPVIRALMLPGRADIFGPPLARILTDPVAFAPFCLE